MGKEEIARHEQFFLFPQCFLLNQKIVCPFVNIFYIISLVAAELEEPKIGVRGKGLKNRNISLKPLLKVHQNVPWVKSYHILLRYFDPLKTITFWDAPVLASGAT